ncbi:hypothetical protein RJ639_000505 [Escallonia herrerae]|uniref:C3H1-type domain-containing protein n=1 Tax=Escallonia herrerae TaxID=1293975 RepID=A0AA88XBQ6_9ASTE|nr:hypothetical protein RJ639_000505 [Escallonia herrerae]
MGRGRGRSSSRSRVRDRSRSSSPLHDYTHDLRGWIDKRNSGSGIASRPCKDFAVGKCRRGSHCRFFHQDNFDSKNAVRSERDITERWRSRPERGAISKYDDYKTPDGSLDKVYDGQRSYYRADEPLKERSKDSNGCRDFLKGRCHRGASCRYPHDSDAGLNYDRRIRSASDVHDHRRQSNRSGKAPCKFFLMGKCHRDDCRFSHDTPVSRSFDERSDEDRWGHSSDDKNKSWNGPRWDDATEKLTDDRWGHNLDDKKKSWNGPTWDDGAKLSSDAAKSTGWGDSSHGNINFQDVAAEKQTGDRWGHNSDGKRKSWNGPTWDDAAKVSTDTTTSTGWGDSTVGNVNLNDLAAEKTFDGRLGCCEEERTRDAPGWNDEAAQRDEYISLRRRTDNSGADVDTTKFMGLEFVDREVPQLFPEGSPSHTVDGVSMPVCGQNDGQEASLSQLATNVMLLPKVSGGSCFQQHQGGRGHNLAITADFNASNEVNVSEFMIHPKFVPGENVNQTGDDMGCQPKSSSGPDRSCYMLSRSPSNGHNVELNGSVQHIFFHLNPQILTHTDYNGVVRPSEMLESGVPRVIPELSHNGVTFEPITQTNNLPASLTHISQNRQVSQPYPVLNAPNPAVFARSHSSSAHVTPPVDQIPAKSTQEQSLPVGDSLEPRKPDTINNPQVIVERSFPVSACDPKEDDHRSPKLKQQEPVANLEVNRNADAVADKPMQEQEKLHLDTHGKIEEGIGNKDEKAMRVFKIALVEFVKEILKPTWKEGQMSREVHKTVVKKAVDKVTSSIQGDQIPKTQEKIDQYLSFSKTKLTKLVQAYVERFSKS